MTGSGDDISEGPSAIGGGAGVTVAIDHGTCSGTAHCQQSMPSVFTVVQRKAHVRADVDWSTIDVTQLAHVADACPWFAITVTTD
jgi:ferredoxin